LAVDIEKTGYMQPVLCFSGITYYHIYSICRIFASFSFLWRIADLLFFIPFRQQTIAITLTCSGG